MTKKCKGTGKALNHGCGDIKIIFKYGLCKACFIDWLYNTPNGKEKLKKSLISSRKKIIKEVKQKEKQQKIENKSIDVLILEARQPFQKLIRIRDHRKGCICCKKILPFEIGKYDAGHFFKAEIYSGLIFHPDNVHGQLVYCNQYLHGNESEYTSGLIERIGWARYQKLNAIKDSLRSYKWDRYQLIEIKKHYSKELREVEKGIKSIDNVDWSIGIISTR